jgi:tRNA G18 (ribose-2'-O)-methylase SpoU
MLSLSRSIFRYAAPNQRAASVDTRRYISLTGAIEKGIRHDQRGRTRLEDRHAKQAGGSQYEEEDLGIREGAEYHGGDGKEKVVLIPGHERRSGRHTLRGPRTVQPEKVAAKMRNKGTDSAVPTSLPYTTAGSEFLYGTFAVLSALKAQRRQLYNLYRLLPPGYGVNTNRARAMQPRESPEVVQLHKQINSQAATVGVNLEAVSGPRWHAIFSKAADGRPHNGWILEASAVPKLPITALSAVTHPSDPIIASVGWNSEEEKAINKSFEVVGNKATIPSVRPAHRYPFMLFLDCITDTGNFGAIARSAWFLGVDAIVIPEHGTAPVTANTVKSSAGAFEYMPILHVKNEREFVKISRRNGWKFFAADAPESIDERMRRIMRQGFAEPLDPHGALLQHPCILVLGNEETGIRDMLRSMVDGVAGVANARPDVGVIDSLNVSVAAAVLTQKFFDTAAAPLDAGKTKPSVEPMF